MKRKVVPVSSVQITSPSQHSMASMKSFKVPPVSTRSNKSINKILVRRLLEDKASMHGNKHQLTLNITYNDIKSKKQVGIKHEVKNFLLSQGMISKAKSCQCFQGKKCQWVARWISFFPEGRSPKYSQISHKINKQINIDLQRTSNNVCIVQEFDFKRIVKNTLIAYCLADPQVSYIQGFNSLVASITVHTKSFYDSYRILGFLMKDKGLREIYINDFRIAKKHALRISQILRNKSYSLFVHMLKIGVELDMFFIGWIIPLFSNLVSQDYMHLVINYLLAKGQIFIYALCLTILFYLREQLLQINCQSDVLLVLSVQSLINRGIPWEEVIQSSNNFPISRKELYVSFESTLLC